MTPLGFRAGFGAAKNGAASGTSSTNAPMAVLQRSAKTRLAIAAKPVARDPARLGRRTFWGSNKPPSPETVSLVLIPTHMASKVLCQLTKRDHQHTFTPRHKP